MIIQLINQTLGDEVALSPNRPSAITDVITEDRELSQRIIIPLKYRQDVDALESYIGSSLSRGGLCITVTLSELLEICPRSRRRLDAYRSLQKFLKEEMNVTLTIKTSKN